MEPRSADDPAAEDQSPIGMKVMIDVMETVARKRALPGYRVVYRVNPKGEHVVAVIWPPESS
jgi:hypothetical protein